MAISSIVCRGFGSFGGGVALLPTRGYGIGAAVDVPDAGPIQLTDWPIPQRRRAEPTTFRHEAIWRKHSRRWEAVVSYYLPVAPVLDLDSITETVRVPGVYELETTPVYFQSLEPVKHLAGEATAFKHFAAWNRERRKFAAKVRVVHNDDLEVMAFLGMK